MALTENNFSDAELETAITTNKDLIPVIEKVVGKQGYIFRSKDANATYETGLRDQITKEAETLNYTSTEKEITDITGLKRDAAKETVPQFRARVLKSLKDGNETAQQEITRLKGATDLTATEKKRLADLEENISTLNSGFATERKEWEKKLTMAEAKTEIGLDISTIRPSYLKTIPAETVKLVEGQAIADIMKSAKMEGGKLVFTDAAGEIMRNPKTFMPLTAADMLLAHPALKSIVDPGYKQTGAASANRESGTASVLPDGVTTGPELTEWLIKKGFKEGTAQMIAEFDKYGGDKLPLWK